MNELLHKCKYLNFLIIEDDGSISFDDDEGPSEFHLRFNTPRQVRILV